MPKSTEMKNRVEYGHGGKFGPILDFVVPFGFNGLTYTYYIFMDYWSVWVGLLFTPSKVMGIVRISLSTLIMDPMRSLGHNSGRSGVGWW